MATEAELRKKIKELQKEIDQINRDRRKMQNEMTAKTDREMQQLKAKYQSDLRRQKNETDEEYSRRLRDFQNEMTRRSQQESRDMQRQTERMLAAQNAKLEELSQANDELLALLKTMKQRTEQTDEAHKAYALQLIEEARQSRQETDKKPHEFFYNGEFAIIDSHCSELAAEIDRQMYQAAAADAGSVLLEFDLLATKTDKSLEEWMQAFADYSSIVKRIARQIELLEEYQLTTAAGTFVMKENELEFWSSGTYIAFREKIRGALAQINDIEKKGIEQYLKTADHRNRKHVFALVTDAKRWSDELSGITNCILSERLLSDERWALAQAAEKALKDKGYRKVKKKFREPDAYMLEQKWYPSDTLARSCPLECFDLIMTVQGEDMLNITYVPFRENGLAVRNYCIISLTAVTVTSPDYVNAIVGSAAQTVRSVSPNLNVLTMGEQAKQQTAIKAQEQSGKKQPSPEQQITYLERKYK